MSGGNRYPSQSRGAQGRPPPQTSSTSSTSKPHRPTIGNARHQSQGDTYPINDPKLLALVQRVTRAGIGGPNQGLHNVLDAVRAAAKGDDRTKSTIGHHLIPQLIRLLQVHQHDPRTAVAAAKLLRSITVAQRNKERLQPFGRAILQMVTRVTKHLQVPLTAVLWNMSSIPSNRDVLVKDGVLQTLATLLSSTNTVMSSGEVQTEAAGATRNFTLDERYLAEFSKTNMIETLLSLLSTTSSRSLLACILVALRNISTNTENQKKLATPSTFQLFGSLLRASSVNPAQDHKYLLETIANISQNPFYQPMIASSQLDDALIRMVNSNIEMITRPANIILRNISASQVNPHSLSRLKMKEAILQNDLLEQSTEDGYISRLLEKLHIDEDPVRPQDILLKRQIGEGAYGSVYLAEYHGYPVACKVIKAGLNRTNAERLLDELRVMKKLKHPNVVLLMGACLNEEKQIMILTEFVSRGDLKHCLGEITSLSKRMRIMRDVAQGLNWLGSMKIVHRDLKLDNLLVTEDWSVKITDFGLSIQNDDGQLFDRFGGNVKYSAPEILKERFINKTHSYAYGERTDVYSYGLICWQVLTKQDPFRKRPPTYRGKEGLVQYILEDKRPALPRRWPVSLCQLLSACWSGHPPSRPTFREILDNWDVLTVDLLCPDPLGQHIYRTIWRDPKKKVTVEEVLKVFNAAAMPTQALSLAQTDMMEDLIRDSAFDDTVSYDRFCYVVSWFGPLDAATNCEAFFRRMEDTLKQDYFHGFVTNQKSDNKLNMALQSDSSGAYFLVKYSFDSIGEFILTFINSEGRINYVKIRNIGGMWQIGTSPKQYMDWSVITAVCKQVIGIGQHIAARR